MKYLWYRFQLWRSAHCYKHDEAHTSTHDYHWCQSCSAERMDKESKRAEHRLQKARKGLGL